MCSFLALLKHKTVARKQAWTRISNFSGLPPRNCLLSSAQKLVGTYTFQSVVLIYEIHVFFIRYSSSTGLSTTHITTIFQLACQLNWWSTGQYKTRTEGLRTVRIPIQAWIFQFCFLANAYVALLKCEKHAHSLSRLFMFLGQSIFIIFRFGSFGQVAQIIMKEPNLIYGWLNIAHLELRMTKHCKPLVVRRIGLLVRVWCIQYSPDNHSLYLLNMW